MGKRQWPMISSDHGFGRNRVGRWQATRLLMINGYVLLKFVY